MNALRRLLALPAAACMLAAAHHVPTSDYWMGYSGTKNVPAQYASRWLSWVETDNHGAALISRFGVKTMMYTNPNREQPGDPLFGQKEDEYAHTCTGQRARGEAQYRGLVMTNPKSQALKSLWRRSVQAHAEGAHFDAVFADEAVGAAYAQDQPCGYNFDDWLDAEMQLFRSLPYPVVYNGLNDFKSHGMAPEIALNAAAAGGMMEECYAQLHPDHRVAGWQWWATEETEIAMASQHKYFFCYGRDLTAADQAYEGRIYTYASYLLTYDPSTTVLWEYYKTPSGAHVMPESQLVALDPLKTVSRVAQLRAPGGAYVREYRKCYIDARSVGACAAAVNPDDTAHPLTLRGYRRTLALDGSGLFDGGTIHVANAGPPAVIPPRGAVIAFK